MDIFDQYFVELLEALAKNNVEYIMFGSFAVNMRGFNRTTADIYLNDNLDNRKKIRSALKDALIGDFETIIFIQCGTSISLNNGMELDILTSLKGVEDSFDDCFAQASIAEIFNLKIPFLHINHLIQNKIVVNRPKDQINVIELNKIKYANIK
jgi:hypothetical protein